MLSANNVAADVQGTIASLTGEIQISKAELSVRYGSVWSLLEQESNRPLPQRARFNTLALISLH